MREKKRYGWAPKHLQQPYFETKPMRRYGSPTRDRMQKWAPGCVRAHRIWASTDRDFTTPLRGRLVINCRETWHEDDPFGALQKTSIRAKLVVFKVTV